jgi:hypothetical protein
LSTVCSTDKQITFVADIDFDQMRLLARHVLSELREAQGDPSVQDPEDPMTEVKTQRRTSTGPVKVPRLNADIWKSLLAAHDGNASAAQTAMDRLLKGEADRLREAKGK